MIYKKIQPQLYDANIQSYKIYPKLHIYKSIQTCSHFLQTDSQIHIALKSHD